MATTIYRIETSEGSGMYCSGASSTTCELQDVFRHPMPDEDDLLSAACLAKADDGGHIAWASLVYYKFGFSSIEQLRRWIYQDTWLRQLSHDGLVIAVIESDDVLLGHTQAMFNGYVSKEQHDIIEFFNLIDPKE